MSLVLLPKIVYTLESRDYYANHCIGCNASIFWRGLIAISFFALPVNITIFGPMLLIAVLSCKTCL